MYCTFNTKKNSYHNFSHPQKDFLLFASKKVSKRKKSKYLPSILSLCKNNLYMLVEKCCLLHFFFGKNELRNKKDQERERERWLKKNETNSNELLESIPCDLLWESMLPLLGTTDLISRVRERVTRDIGGTRGKNKFLMTPVPTRSSVCTPLRRFTAGTHANERRNNNDSDGFKLGREKLDLFVWIFQSLPIS